MIRRTTTVLALSLLAGCTIVPEDSNRGELIASAGVREMFEKSEPDPSRIKCRRERRTGSHLLSKTCMTLAEWEEKAAKSRDEYVDHMAFPPCSNPDPAIGKPYACAPVVYGPSGG